MLYRFGLPGLICLVHVSLCHVSVVSAADDATAPFAGNEDVPTVLSATRLQQSLFDVPAAVTIIDRQMIEQSGMREIPELLRLVPGMVVGYDTGSEVFVSFHGTSADLARRMQVLIDGRSIYQPLLATVDWTGLPLELADIERIEVIRGPNSAAWGANSFFAVVNIITRHPEDVDRARLSYTRGNDGVEDFLARIAQHTGAVDWRLSVAGRSDDGFQTNRITGQRFADRKDVDSVYGRGVWSPQPATTVELGFGSAHMLAEQQYRATFFTSPPVAERENRYLSLAWDQELNASNRLRMQVNDSYFQREEPWTVNLPRLLFLPVLGDLYTQNRACAIGLIYGGGNTSTCTSADVPLLMQFQNAIRNDPALRNNTDFYSGVDSREERTEVELHDTWAPASDFRAVFGLTYDRERADSQVYLNGHDENTVWDIFAHGEWRFAPAWTLNVGGNQEYSKVAGKYFTPRYAINWRFTDNQVLRAVYSKAVRTPDILENRADWRYTGTAVNPADAAYSGTFFQTGKGAGDAPTERIASSELGYYGRSDPLRTTLDIRLFYDRMELSNDNIAVDGNKGFIIAPTEKLRQQGAEVGLDWRPWPSQRLQLNYAFIDMDGSQSDRNTNFVPRHSGSAAWWQDYSNGWQLGTTYAFYDKLRVDQFYFDRLEMRLAKKIPLPRQQSLELAAVAQARLSNDPELRKENGGARDRNRGWLSLDWRY